MRAVLDPPVVAGERQQTLGISAGWVEAGDSVDGLGANLARRTQDRLPAEAKDLLETRPVAVVGEGRTDGQTAALDAPVCSVDRLGVQLRIVLGRLGEDEGDIGFQSGLIAPLASST